MSIYSLSIAAIFGIFFVLVLIVLINLLISIGIADAARKKGHSWALFFWVSFLVNWLVMLAVVLLINPKIENNDLASTPTTCSFCKESVRADATVCKHCGKDIEPTLPSLLEQERVKAQKLAKTEREIAEANFAKQAAKDSHIKATQETRQAAIQKVYKSKVFRISIIFMLGTITVLTGYFVISSEISRSNRMDIKSGIASCDSQKTDQTTYSVDEVNDKITITFSGEGLNDSDTRIWLDCVGTALVGDGVAQSFSGALMSKANQNPDLNMVTITYSDLAASLSNSMMLEIYRVKND